MFTATRARPAAKMEFKLSDTRTAVSDDEPMGLILGQTPGSREEWRVYLALVRYKLQFAYQVPVRGGRQRRGGQVVDFVVYNPFAVAVPVNGEYWHRGQMAPEERLKLAVLEVIFGRAPVVLWAAELQTQAMTNAVVRRELL